jgi:hypothetical protein
MIRRWLARRRHRQASAAVYADRRARMPWLHVAAAMHHTQHPGEVRDDCGVCNPSWLVRLLDEISPLPGAVR